MDNTASTLARSMMRSGDLDAAARTVKATIENADRKPNTVELWRLRFIRAEILEMHGQVEGALAYLESLSPPLVDDIESTGALKMYRGSFLGFLGRYQTSHQLFEEGEAMARDAGFDALLGDICLSRAFIFFRQKNYGSSAALFHAALDLSDKVGGWYLRGHGLWGIGKNLMIQEHHSEAVPWLEESLAIFGKSEARLAIAMVWSELAVCYLGLGDDHKAMELFRRAEQVNRACGVVHNYQVVLANIGNVYLHRRDYFTAISYYQRALALARQIKDPVSIKKWMRNINLAYARIRQAVDEAHPVVANP